MPFKLVVIGASQGGLNALDIFLSGLPKQFPIALVIAQHRHAISQGYLVTYLQQQSALPVIEVQDKQPIVAGQVYLAPADYHVLVEPGHFALSTEAPVTYARPSIDVLFESAADAYGKQVIGIILTGASHDGAQGLGKVSAYGGLTLVQDPATAESRTMPDAALAAVPTAKVLPLPEIVPFLVNLVAPSTPSHAILLPP
ncbi:MAG TPA: chemotaxis protein CheB [Trichocoleus sp.]